MHEVVLVEDGCCNAGQLDGLQAFLRERLGDRATVTKYGVGGHLGFSAVPPELVNRLLAQGANAVPVVALDGDLLFHGDLPEPEAQLRAIEERIAARAGDPEHVA
jgi:hypothetical protein